MTRTDPPVQTTTTACMKPLRWLLRRAYRIVHRDKSSVLVGKCGSRDSQQNSNEVTTGFGKANNSSSKATIFADSDVDEEEQVLLKLFKLPVQVRQFIYDLIGPSDILSLRLTCNTIKKDVESLHGVYMRVHDGRLDYEKALQKFGIAQLNVEQLIQQLERSQSHLTSIKLFPHPELLKKLVISGTISSENMELLLHVSCNLTELRLDFQSFGQKIPIADYLKSHPLVNLQTFCIKSNTTPEVSESPFVLDSIRSYLNDMSCPNLLQFSFYLDGLLSNRMREYHEYAYNFITRNESLKKINVQLRQLGPTITNLTRENITLYNELHDSRPMITVLELKINNNAHLWYPLLDSQTCLRSLNLQCNSQTWNRLILTLDKNARTLKSLIIAGLCSTLQDGITTLPVDFGLVRNLRALENLEIQHIDMESRGAESPKVLRTSSLPLHTLKTVKLCHLQLKPHQAMLLLVKLPSLVELELECWSDTEGTLAGYISVVTFLLKFDLTPVKTLGLTDSRRRMENLRYEINKMKSALTDNVADVNLTNTELYSTLCILRH